MKKFWFRRKIYGWGWYPATWQGWFIILLYLAILVLMFRKIDAVSHSGSDTLIGFVVPVWVLTAALVFVAWLTGEKPRWQWGCLPRRPRRRQGKRIEDAADVLLRGDVAVIPTDTTYGIVGSAFNERTVNEIYRLRKRDLNKPFIVLIADRKDLKQFSVVPTEAQEKILRKVWPTSVKPTPGRPGPVSVILPCVSDKFAYLHRGQKTIAFRVPQKAGLRSLLRQIGPLVAPSANPQGLPVAKTIAEARAYFGHHVDFYEDGGALPAVPSRLIDITDGTEKILRP